MKLLSIVRHLSIVLGLSIVAAHVCAGNSPAASRDRSESSVAPLAPLEAALLLQTLNTDLLSHDSATLTLERWCKEQHLAPSPRIVAQRVSGANKRPTDEERSQLAVKPNDPVRYRRVRLACGDVVLSEADNWYVPERLTPEINKTLDTTDTPFGKAAQSLHFRRHTISVRVLASLLPDRWWEMDSSDLATKSRGSCLPPYVLEHRALLTLPDGTPFSEVVETYTVNVLSAVRSKIKTCSPG